MKRDVLFFGSDTFSIPIISALHRLKCEGSLVGNLEVVCPPDKVKGRGLKLKSVPLKEWAASKNLVCHDAPRDSHSLKDWKMPTNLGKGFDFSVVASFGYFISPHVLNAFRCGNLNVHPSILPKYRGASPIQYALLQGDKECGVSIIDVHGRTFDAGKIFHQLAINVEIDKMDYFSLESLTAEKGAALLISVLENFEKFNSNAREQDEAKVTYAPKIIPSQGMVRWDCSQAIDIDRQVRAISHQVAVKTSFRGKDLHLLKVKLPDNIELSCSPGSLVFDKMTKALYVQCKFDWLELCEMWYNGKILSAYDFVNGYHVCSEKDFRFV